MSADYDLTHTMMQYVDRHQARLLLEFLQEQKLYNPKDLQKAKYQLVAKTKMVDCAIIEYKALHDVKVVPKKLAKEFDAQREQVFADYERTENACGPLKELLKDLDDGESRISLETLRTKNEVTPDNIQGLYDHARIIFDIGSYEKAANALAIFRKLSDDEEKKFGALWGKLAAEIIMYNDEVALEDLKELRQEIDRQVFSDHFAQLQQRTWMIHWSMFIFFNLEGGLGTMMEFLMQEKLLNTIQTQCPHILRYVATAVVINKVRRNMLKDVVKILISEQDVYSDPLTELVVAVYSEFDFEKAQKLLPLCQQVIQQDYLLGNITEDSQDSMAEQFAEGARLLVFETACRIHKCIGLDKLTQYLGLEEKEADTAIVKLISESSINANIDSANRQLIVSTQKRTAPQVVIDLSKSRNLENRSNQLIGQVKKKYDLLDQAA